MLPLVSADYTCVPLKTIVTISPTEILAGQDFTITASITNKPSNSIVSAAVVDQLGYSKQIVVGTKDLLFDKWYFKFSGISTAGQYTIKVYLTGYDNNEASGTYPFSISPALDVTFSPGEKTTQYVGQDITANYIVNTPNVVPSCTITSTFRGQPLTLNYNIVPQLAGRYNVVIPSGQITSSGELDLFLRCEDLSGAYGTVVKPTVIQMQIATLGVNLELPTGVKAGDERTITITTSGINGQSLDVDQIVLTIRTPSSGTTTIQCYQSTCNSIFVHTSGTGVYKYSYKFLVSQSYYFLATARSLSLSSDGASGSPPGTEQSVAVGPGPTSCGNGQCESDKGEDKTTCPQDCGSAHICGDQTCDAGETSSSCPEDCGSFPWMYVVIAILAVVIIAIMYFLFIKK